MKRLPLEFQNYFMIVHFLAFSLILLSLRIALISSSGFWYFRFTFAYNRSPLKKTSLCFARNALPSSCSFNGGPCCSVIAESFFSFTTIQRSADFSCSSSQSQPASSVWNSFL